jgi:hypothetical protein
MQGLVILNYCLNERDYSEDETSSVRHGRRAQRQGVAPDFKDLEDGRFSASGEVVVQNSLIIRFAERCAVAAKCLELSLSCPCLLHFSNASHVLIFWKQQL